MALNANEPAPSNESHSPISVWRGGSFRTASSDGPPDSCVPVFDDQLHTPRPGDVTTPVLVVAAGFVEYRDLRDVPGEMQWLRHRTAFSSV